MSENIYAGKNEAVTADPQYTPRQILEIRGARIFLGVIALTSSVATIFQLLAGHDILTVLPTVSFYCLAVLLSYIIYKRKKALAGMGHCPLVIAFIVSVIPFIARYSYTVKIDWLYATQCINVYGISLATLIAFQFLYDKKVYIIMTYFVFFELDPVPYPGMEQRGPDALLYLYRWKCELRHYDFASDLLYTDDDDRCLSGI